jgi:hypothetical protein
MSAERVLPPANSRRYSAGTLFVVALIAFAVGGRIGMRRAQSDEVMTASPPAVQRIAMVRSERCDGGRCQTLWLGRATEDAVKIATLAPGKRVEEIAWSRDGFRMGFLIDGRELRVFDSEPFKPVATVQLAPKDGDRFARGVTFSDNGRAVTFDDCPRGRSGCRSGLAGVR